MQLVLVLPGLAARAPHGAPRPEPRSLARLVASACAPEREPEGLAALLAHHYGVPRQQDWPLAPLRLAALGVAPGDAYWLAADPVTLVAGRDDVRPAGTVRDLAREDADRLIGTLNRHFATDGIAFVAPRPDAWFVRAPSPPRMVTHALDAAVGRALRTLLPEGPDAASWRRWLGEVQMLFHDHPVNAARERSGAASVNSVWFSGGGTMPPPARSGAPTRTWARGDVACALAAYAASTAHALPADLAAVLRHGRNGERLVVALDAPLDLAVAESAWAKPAWAALASGKLESVTLLVDGAGDALALRVPRPGPWARVTKRFAHPPLDALLDGLRSAC